MSKKIFFVVGLSILLVVACLLNVSFNSKKGNLSDVSLANVEALAKSEDWDNFHGIFICWGVCTDIYGNSQVYIGCTEAIHDVTCGFLGTPGCYYGIC